MKMRVIGLVSAILVLMSMFSLAFAMPVGAASKAIVTVGSVSGKVGTIVEVPVSVSAGSYIVNADMYVTFDPTKLELVDTYYEDFTGDEGDTCCYLVNTTLFNSRWMYKGNERAEGEFLFSAATGNNTGLEMGGVMFTLAFKILTESANGTEIAFSAAPICANDGSGETGVDGYPMDFDLTYVALNGQVSVTVETTTTTTTQPKPDESLGDLNNDTQVNMFDALLLYGYLGGVRELTEQQVSRSDITGDGVINMMDALTLFREASGF